MVDGMFKVGRMATRSAVTRLKNFRVNTVGGVTAMVALMSPVLIGAMGLGGEAGYWYLTQRKVQNAADVAAHATAVRLNEGEELSNLQSLAEFLVEGAEVSLTTAAVQLNQPPTEGGFIEDGAAVEVVVTQTVQRLFSGIYSQDPVTITARAVATALGGSTGCVLALNNAVNGAMTIGGTSMLTLINCDVISNSNAISVEMPGASSTMIANCIRAAGTVDLNIAVTLSCGAAVENASATGDPLAGLAEPAITGTCEDGAVGSNGTVTTVTPTEVHASGMMSRRYCNGLDVRGTTTFSPGLYIIEGGEFLINANAVVAGTGVVFYLADGVEIVWNGSATTTFAAPTSGTYSGMLIFGSRDDTTDEQHQINGSFASTLDGALYTPTSDLQFSGNGGTSFTGCTQVIADEIEFTGSSIMTLHCLFPPPSPVITVAGDANIVE